MRFTGKTPEGALPKTRESVHNPETGGFHDFVGGYFDTDNEKVIEFLKGQGYQAVELAKEVPVVGQTVDEVKPEPKKAKAKK